MMVLNFAQNTSETIAPTSGKKYAPTLNSEFHVAALASVKCRKFTMYTARIELIP